MKVYEYPKCSTCKKALKYLDTQGIFFEKTDITENPPTQKELKMMLEILKSKGGSLKNLFNTSGVQYRELNMSEKLKSLSEADAIKLLAQNGKLIKRPFILNGQKAAVGFDSAVWEKIISR